MDLDSLDKAVPFNYYPESIWTGTEVFGSCNGLLALSNSEHDIALFNPATRKFYKLPVSYIDMPQESCIRGFVFYGFGHDFINDDYKVVRMVQFKKDEDDNLGWFIDYEVKVFSLKTKSWRRIKNLPKYLRFMFQFYYHLLHRRGYAVYANGVLHWVSPRRPEFGIDNVIIAFDLGVEEFRVLPQPDSNDFAKDFVLDVGVLEGHLCAVCNYDLVKLDVWMMKEYGVKESWTKLFSIERSRTMSSLRFLRPLIYSYREDGDKILLELNGEKLVWYDFKRRKLKTVKISGGPDSFVACIYVESLVPLDNGSCGIGKKKPRKIEEKKKQIRKKR